MSRTVARVGGEQNELVNTKLGEIVRKDFLKAL